MSGNGDGAKTAKIEVWWDMNDCPIPREGYDARRVRPSIERAFKELGYSGPVSITAYGDQKQTPCHVLRGLSSTGVTVAHTNSESRRSVMYRDMVEWRGQNPPPATIMIISDQLEANWRWEQLLSEPLLLNVVEEEEEGGGLSLSPACMFYCKSCDFNCKSLKKYRKHLSSYEHGLKEAVDPPYTRLLCVTKNWARNHPATPEHATAKILVLWSMKDCPIPEGYDARRVRPSIERAFKELGYSGPVSITAYANHNETPHHHLSALSSTGVDFAHVLPWVAYSSMYSDLEEWKFDNPAPASFMIISDKVASCKNRSSIYCTALQRSNYNCFLAYSVRPFEMPVLLTSAEWLWDSLLAVSETRGGGHTLQKCSGSEMVVASAAGMFCCRLCYCDCKSLDAFNKHLSSYKHTKEEHRMLSHMQSLPREGMLYRISKYHDRVGYPPKKTIRMKKKKATWKGFVPRPLRFTRR
ncbi:zinc finger protein-related [Raphanus sativus]|nr:zinc finger protein-related [Raphanus sativus]